MEFELSSGFRLTCWFSAGDVVSTRSWIYRGDWHHETWIRNTDGREWKATGGLLGTAVNRGHRLAFAWCAANGTGPRGLVAVRNCSTGESRVISQAIATEYDRRAYGRWGMLFALVAATAVWQGGYTASLPAVVGDHWVLSLSLLVLTAGVVGFAMGALADPDPERKVDEGIQTALASMEYAWRELRREATPRRRSHRSGAQGLERKVADASGFQRTPDVHDQAATAPKLFQA